jgi:O-antigen ligase
MFNERPLSGVGPDNFRLEYGPYAGLANFDTRVHSNNMYLEVLTGGGLIGFATFAWLCVAAAALVLKMVRTADGRTASLTSGVAAATVAVAVHGSVDSFLSFTPTYILIAVTLGLASSSLSLNRTHAHRI